MTVQNQSYSKIAIGIFIFTGAMGLVIITHSGTPFVAGQVLGAVTMGLLVGCIPYYQAKKNKKYHLGQIALAGSTLAGLILGIILALPVALIFTIFVISGNS